MTKQALDFLGARAAYARGENVARYLQEQAGLDHNTPEIIEMAYDLQAGRYIELALGNAGYLEAYTQELAAILNAVIAPGDVMLDVGSGELTTLTYLVNRVQVDVRKIYAFDISWSRIALGQEFASSRLATGLAGKLSVFTADIAEIPMLNDAVDVIISNHALEPNGGRELPLLQELVRIARRSLVLFEPSFENNSPEGQERMIRHGYIRNLPGAIAAAGASLREVVMIRSAGNPLNPTAAYIIDTGKHERSERVTDGDPFADPGGNTGLVRLADCYFSPRRGLSYPVIGGIPILRSSAAVLTSAMEQVIK